MKLENTLTVRQTERDNAISAIRLIAMIFIVLCHFFQYYDNELAWWFNVGVYIFFAVSGFLYGNKDITDPISFIKKNFKKILIPYYIFLIPAIILYFIFAPNKITLLSAVKSIFCVGTIQGLGNLWFVGYILFCYLITPYLYWVVKKLENSSLIRLIISFAVILIFVQILGILLNSYFRPDRISGYIIGYFIAVMYKKYGFCFLKYLCVFTDILCIFANGIRIYFKYILHLKTGSLFSYFENYAQLILGLAIFLTLYIAFKNIKNNRIFKLSDKYSYSVYIVHQFFILSPFNLMAITFINPFNWIIVLAAVAVSSLILKYISEKILRYSVKRLKPF